MLKKDKTESLPKTEGFFVCTLLMLNSIVAVAVCDATMLNSSNWLSSQKIKTKNNTK